MRGQCAKTQRRTSTEKREQKIVAEKKKTAARDHWKTIAKSRAKQNKNVIAARQYMGREVGESMEIGTQKHHLALVGILFFFLDRSSSQARMRQRATQRGNLARRHRNRTHTLRVPMMCVVLSSIEDHFVAFLLPCTLMRRYSVALTRTQA
jgi:predicted ATPase